MNVQRMETPDKSLIDKGYKWVKFNMNDDYEVYTDIYFDVLQKKIPITLSTVADGLTLHSSLFEGKIDIEKVESEINSSGYDSPSGTIVDDFIADSVKFELNNISMVNKADFYDFAK